MRRMAHYAERVTMSSGRHRGPGLLGNGARAFFVAVGLVAGVGALVVWQSVGGGGGGGGLGCSGEVRLSVAAAPEIAPAIQLAGNGWADTARAPGGPGGAGDGSPGNPAQIPSAVAATGGGAPQRPPPARPP